MDQPPPARHVPLLALDKLCCLLAQARPLQLSSVLLDPHRFLQESKAKLGGGDVAFALRQPAQLGVDHRFPFGHPRFAIDKHPFVFGNRDSAPAEHLRFRQKTIHPLAVGTKRAQHLGGCRADATTIGRHLMVDLRRR